MIASLIIAILAASVVALVIRLIVAITRFLRIQSAIEPSMKNSVYAYVLLKRR